MDRQTKKFINMPETDNSDKNFHFIPELLTATGDVSVKMVIDYVFRGIFQKNEKALKGLISSLLHIPLDRITSVYVINSNITGDSTTDKEYRLDINALLNDGLVINVEMQMVYMSYWRDRSLAYLCRDYDKLTLGDSYTKLKPVVHIIIHNDMPLYESKKFYSNYKFMENTTYEVFSDKISLNVLNLKMSENATKEDKKWGIDHWAKLFKSKTWEEVRMNAENNEFLTEAANTFFLFSADEMAKKKAREREDFLRQQRYDERMKQEMSETITKQTEKLAEQTAKLAEKDARIAELEALLATSQSDK